MMRTKLRNTLKMVETRVVYNKQKKPLCFSYSKCKKHYYENHDPNLITDNRKFWKQVKPFVSNKTPNCSKITLEGNQFLNENLDCAEVLNNYFIDAMG